MIWIVDLKERIEARLASFFAAKEAHARAIEPACVPLVTTIGAFTMRGGKRIRPAILAAAYGAVSGDESISPVVEAGAALELLHSYLLIHDDWMDRDELRRGGPTVHVMMRAHATSEHHAGSLAILAGDLASAYAWELLRNVAFGSNTSRAWQAFAALQEEVVLGQYLDLRAHPDFEIVADLKTASYTARGPLRLGALLAGASEAQLELFDRLSTRVGRAFQLRDDLLGTYGDPKKMGKSVVSDAREGKHTALFGSDRERVEAWLREDLERAAQLIADPSLHTIGRARFEALLELLAHRES